MAKKFFKVELIPALRRLQILSKELSTSTTIGAYKSVFKGKGLEFSGYRPYTLGDDASLIDWKATARTDNLLIKEYVEERNLNVFFIVDSSSKMLFGSTNKLKAEYNIELTCSLAHAILEAGDNVGLVLFSDTAKQKLLPTRGFNQYYKISKLLLDPENYGGNFDLENATKFVFNYLKTAGIIVIISDFLNWNDKWKDFIKLLSKKFDLMCIMIRDPRDKTMPNDVGEVVISDPKTGKTMIIEPELIKESYEKVMKEQEDNIKKIFLESNIDFVDISTDKPFINEIINLFIRRSSRRWQ